MNELTYLGKKDWVYTQDIKENNEDFIFFDEQWNNNKTEKS